jgi:hypothetical protein
MKYLILFLSVALLSCQKEPSPEEQIIGTWYIIGTEDETGFHARAKEKAYKFYDGYYEYFLAVGVGTVTYRVEGNHFFKGENPNYFLIEVSDTRLKIANETGDDPDYYHVYEH